MLKRKNGWLINRFHNPHNRADPKKNYSENEKMNRFEGLIEFMAVIETGSFSSAARKLGTSVAHVSRHVARLETRLGTKLFARTTRWVRPTVAGEHLASRSLPLLEELERIQDGVLAATESLEGSIRFSMAGAFVVRQVLPQLANFCTAHPRVRIEVDLSGQKVDLLDGWFDFALRMAPLENSSALVARRFAEMPMVTVASAGLIERLENEAGAPLSPLTLQENLCLSFAGRPWQFYRGEQEAVIEPAGSLCSNSAEILIQAALLGLGVIHIPACDLLETGWTHRLVPLFKDWHSADSAALNIVYARNRFMPSRVRLLINYLLSHAFSRVDGAAQLPIPEGASEILGRQPHLKSPRPVRV